jgi:hypothetical protein
MRGLESTPSQLSLSVGGDAVQGVWGSLSVDARERVLRVLAGVIGRVVSVDDWSDNEQG